MKELTNLKLTGSNQVHNLLAHCHLTVKGLKLLDESVVFVVSFRFASVVLVVW